MKYFETRSAIKLCIEKIGESLISPIIFNDSASCGFGILFEENGGLIFKQPNTRNLVAAWRAIEMLPYLKIIKGSTLQGIHYASIRDVNTRSFEVCAKPIIDEIGQEIYNKIMSTPVPGRIINAIIDSQNSKFSLDLKPISEEIKAKTIEWQSEFKEFNIKKPKNTKRKTPLLNLFKKIF